MKRAAVIILSLLAGLPARLLAAPPLEDILKALEHVDGQIGVVKTEGHTHEYLWDAATGSWKITPVTSTFTCVIENKWKGRYVLDQNPSVNRWIDGTAPYLAMWTTEFRDGDGFITYLSKTTQLYDGTQFLGVAQSRCAGYQASRRKEPEYSTEPAETLFSGLTFTGWGAVRHTPVQAPTIFKGIVVSDTKNGMTRVHYTASEICVGFDFVLDPKKNFALVRYAYSDNRQLTTADEERTFTYEVLEHRQIADGVWYPVHYTSTERYSKEYAPAMHLQFPQRDDLQERNRYVSRRMEVVLSNVTILEGREAETNLTVSLPEGTTVINEGEH
ncbi:MAG TPA: hypothetical protein VNL17_16355 [Verrucomicrobiae bacterium]|nr:hypothetical protein [Verrucomicrobiae bacterium]